MNFFRLIVAFVLLALGLVVGLQNGGPPIALKLLTFSWQTTPGVAIILSLLAGVVIGALIVLAVLVWPLYNKLRRVSKQAAAASPVPSGIGN
ncbi:MAG: hypothetical protein QM761_07755 [Pseudoxanthomonas sp.]